MSSNLVKWIEELAEEEKIKAVVIGEMGWGDYKSEAVPNYATHPREQVLNWEEAKKHIDYEFDSGHGAPECEAIYAWTKTWLIFIVQYDGATWPVRMPRNPTAIMPEMPGG